MPGGNRYAEDASTLEALRSFRPIVRASNFRPPAGFGQLGPAAALGISAGAPCRHHNRARRGSSDSRRGMATMSRLNSSAPEYVPPVTVPATPRDAKQGLSVRLPTEEAETPRPVAPKRGYCAFDSVPFTPGTRNTVFKSKQIGVRLGINTNRAGLDAGAGSGVVTPSPMSQHAAALYWAQTHEGHWCVLTLYARSRSISPASMNLALRASRLEVAHD